VRIRLLSTLTVAALTAVMYSAGVASAAAPDTCPLPAFGAGQNYHPAVDPAAFGPDVDNPWFPLPVGTTLVYAGAKEGQQASERFTPTAATRVVDGVRTRVVRDLLYLDGVLAERTSDYYAQDRCGNVWYFGEDTAELKPDGTVNNTDGSFHAGVDGAQPGVFMQAAPDLGRRFRQEWYAGQAEDTFQAADLCTPITVAAGSYRCALHTEERTALEPGVLDAKYYARGIGTVLELAVKGPAERLMLTSVER